MVPEVAIGVSYSRGGRSRTLLNLMFAFALRHDAISHNPVEGTSRLPIDAGRVQAIIEAG